MHAPFLLGLVMGGAVIYWFSGASMQAVATGAYRAVEFIKQNIKLEGSDEASIAGAASFAACALTCRTTASTSASVGSCRVVVPSPH